MRSSQHFKTISRILILAILHLCWLTSYGYSEMLPTESAIEQPSTSNTDRQRILDLMDRREVVDEFEKYGISKVEATARINSLTDEEVIQIAGKLDELPEGGFGFGPSGCHRVIVNGKVVSESSGCNRPDGGAVLAVIGILILVVIFFIWLFRKARVDSPSSKEGPASETVVEEVCDPGMESCIWCPLMAGCCRSKTYCECLI